MNSEPETDSTIIITKRSVISNHSDSSSSSLEGSASTKICRICHVVEHSKHKKDIIRNHSKFDCSDMGPMTRLLKQIKTSFNASDSWEEELIAPCECKGTMRFVHRGCLNQWRTASPRSDSFTRCEQCFASYTFKHNWITSILTHPTTIYTACAVLFAAWIFASTVVSTGAYSNGNFGTANIPSGLFNLLPVIYFDSGSRNPVINVFPLPFIYFYNDVMEYFCGLFYGLVFVALTEFIFFTPSFILSFNTLFCIWRIQKYEIFLDKWLLVAFTAYGIFRAYRSLHEMIEAATTRIVKLKLLQVVDAGDMK